MKKVSNCLFALALVLSHSMLATVSVYYVKIYLEGLFGLYAVPASSAWMLSIPFFFAITVCLVLAWAARRNEKQKDIRTAKAPQNAASRFFIVMAFILSHSMVATIGGSYVLIQRILEELGLRAVRGTPPVLSFLWVIPFGVGIALCLGMAYLLDKPKK